MSDDHITIADTLASLKIACDAAPDGPGKQAALSCYRAAEKAHIARNAAHTIMEIEAAVSALGGLGRSARQPAGPGDT